jgi:hypothetical protein
MVDNYQAIKFKLHTIVNDPKLSEIINHFVLQENKIIFEGTNLINYYIFYCLDNNIHIKIDTTLIRQCCMLAIDSDKKLGIIKTNFTQPDLIDKSAEEIRIIKKEMKEKKVKAKKKGNANRNRLKILKCVYNNYFPKQNLEKFIEEAGITLPIETFSKTFLANIENHFALNYFSFQLRYLTSIVKNKLSKFDLNDKQISIISRYIQKCITLNEEIIFTHSDTFPATTYSKIDRLVKLIIEEQIKLLTIKRFKYVDLELTPNTSMFYKKRYDKILRDDKDGVIKYYAKLIKYLAEKKESTFTIIPQISLGYQHIMFDSRIMNVIYNKWKGTALSVKTFNENYFKYFNEMFNIKKKCARRYKGGYKPKLLSTDGFSVSVLFAKKKVKKEAGPKTKAKKKAKKIAGVDEKIDLSTLNGGMLLRSGMFDAKDITCSDEYLEYYYKKGIDSGNQYMISQVSEAGRSTIITKGYYNEISHINLNKRKQENLIKDCKMSDIYEELSDAPRTTTKCEDYNKYVLIVRKHSQAIWTFYGRDDVRGLKYDSYVNKRSAICKIVKELVPKIRGDKRKEIYNDDDNEGEINEEKWLSEQDNSRTGRRRGEHRKHKKNAYFDADKHEMLKGMPTMIAFGKGNGDLSINNTKGCSPHGPIKRIVKELSKVSLVILTDENYSSQMCCKCETKLLHPKVIEDINKTKIKQEQKKKDEDETYITRMQRINDGRRLKAEIKLGGQSKSRKEKELAKLRVEYECYKLCCCKNKECGHKLWHRDINAAINMITIMTRTLTKKPLGAFEKK